ncbi:MAG: DUF4270 domain-containing protein [Flavobacterium sp.]
MNQKNILKGISLVLGLVALQACESEFTDTGNDLIGGGNFDIVSYKVNDIKAYNQAYGPVDGSRLSEVPFGYLDNGIFGGTSNNLVVQFNESSASMSNLGDNIKVDSVYVYVPYFSQFEKTEDKVNIYKLKNVYGTGAIDLKVYQNGYHLMDVDLANGAASKFFTNEGRNFDNNIVGGSNNVLNTSNKIDQNTAFIFKNTEMVIYKRDKDGNVVKDEKTGEDVIKERLIPGMWLDLDKDYFTKFITENKTKLGQPNGFNEVFKGFYFKTDGAGTDGATGLLDIAKGKVVLIFHADVTSKDADGKEIVKNERKEVSIPFGANTLGSKKFTVNTMNTKRAVEYTSAKSEETTGAQTIYLKGGEGNMAIIDFFKTNDFAELQELKKDGSLLNDAYLTIFVDKEKMGKSPIPERLFLYDFDNSIALSDFVNDQFNSAQYIKQGYSGIFVKEDKDKNKEGYYYKFKITDHIRGLLKNKNNVSPKLALVVANNFSSAGYTNQKLQTKIENKPTDVVEVSSFSVSTPLGVVLHGTNAVQEDKKMKLELFYTKAKK